MKPLRLITCLAGIPVIAALLTGCSAYDRRVHARTDQTRDSATQVQEGYDTFGRKWDGQSQTPAPAKKVAAAQPAPKQVTRKAPDYSATELQTGLVNLNKRVPSAASVGEQFSYDLTATAVQDSGYVIVTDTIPPGATYVKSEPPATRDGNLLTWKLPAMNKGEVKNIKVWLKADREGELAGCATVTAVPRGCVSTFVGKPALVIQKTGPQTALLGNEVSYSIVVQNTGTSVAKDVVVTDAVPEGLTHSSGKKSLTFNVGNLAPKQSKTLPVTFRAAKRGEVCNTAVASSSNAGKVQDKACTVIVQPGLKVFKTGIKEQFLTRRATYQIVVTNTGDTTLKGVVVTDSAPQQTSIVSASGASITGSSAVWNIAELRPHQARNFSVTLTSKQPGNFCNRVTATAAGGLKDSAQACTLWKGLSAILIEMVDDPDPIQVGESTTYTIRVTNQGTADDRNVTIVAQFPKEVTPTTAQGGAVSGQVVRFAPVKVLGPKQQVTYTITAKGAQVGDARIKALLNSEQLKTPVTEEESTTVY